MRSSLLTAAFCSISTFLAAQPTFQWAETVPNVATPGELAYVVDLDVAPDGSAYVTGLVNGPRAIVGDFIVEGGTYVARYDTSGTCLWARSPGGAKIAMNGNNGVYVVGSFSGTMQFGGSSLIAGGLDAFVAKYDANGQPLWARKMGGALNDCALSVAVDGLGRVHVGGCFRGTGTFGGTSLIATQDSTGFHATWDTNGNFQWAVIAGGLNTNDGTAMLSTMSCDAVGNTIMAGNFDDTGTFGSTTLTATDFDKLYLARFDASGNCSWAFAMGADFGNEPMRVGITPAGNIFLYGGFWGTAAVFGSTTLPNADFSHLDIFLAHFDANGSAQWAQKVGAAFFNDFPSSLDVDDAGNAWVAGRSSYTSLFGTITLTDGGNFLAQYDEAGTALMAEHFTTATHVFHALGANGDHFICGNHTGAEFDQGSGVNVGTALWQGQEGYLAHYHDDLGYHWMRRMGLHSTANDAANTLVTDAADNVYTAGQFTTTAIICDDTLRAPLAATHIWLNKRDPNGDCIWTTHISCSEPTGLNQTNTPASLVLDANGDLYFTGRFFGTIDFGVTQLVSAGKQDIFLAKYDNNGVCLWAIGEGGSGEDEGASVVIDPNGDLLLTGWYTGSASIAGNTLSSQGYADGFLAKYDPSGSAIWSKSFGGSNWDNGYGVAVDLSGNYYITGRYTNSATFDALTVNGSGDADLYVAKYDPDGDLSWITGSTDPGWKQANSIVVGASGQVYITGQYNGTLTVCTSSLTGDALNYHAFLSCFDTSGTLLWQHEFPAVTESGGGALTARPAGDIVLTGHFAGTMNVGAIVLNSTDGSDAWVASFNSAGQELWAQAMTGTDFWDYAGGGDVVADEQNVYVVGSFGDFYFTAFDQTGGTLAFDPGDPGSVRFAPNAFDGFIVKYGSVENISPPYNPLGCDGTVQVATVNRPLPGMLLTPNPVDRFFTLTGQSITSAATITVRDMSGRVVLVTSAIRSDGAMVDASGLSPGAYMISVRTDRGERIGRFIKN